eukprot:TRINITY_DN372_c0_g1_i2.p1 TRINITY_DN372_c0_g1~~TRINITY_DN372_c0_g1_i2.p1  ORF type:complete len:1378 (+),score=337.52 TRINITY_DN372_c0_g1_i2:53-4186(+)
MAVTGISALEADRLQWMRTLVTWLRRLLIFQQLPVTFITYFTTPDFPLVSWLMCFASHAIGLYGPWPLEYQHASITINALFWTCYMAMISNGVHAFAHFCPTLHVIHIGTSGGAASAFSVLLSMQLIHLIFLYFHQIGLVFPWPDYVMGMALPQWISTMLVHVTFLPIYLIRMLQPLADLQVKTDKLRKTQQDLEVATNNLQQSLARYSHEIRTPLNIICALSETVQQSREASAVPDIGLLQSTAQSMLAQANNVLDVLAVEIGALHLDSAKFNVANVSHSIVTGAQFAAEVKKIEFTYHLEHTVPTNVVGDSMRFQQALRALMNFMIRYAQEGSVNVKMTASVTDDIVSLYVDVFTSHPVPVLNSGDSNAKTRYGLSVVDMLSRVMQGRFTIEAYHVADRPLMSMMIPFVVAVVDNRPKRALKILYADDEPANHFVVKILLKGTAHVISAADDGDSAIEAFKKSVPDIVLLDVEMPRKSGVAAAKAIRAYEIAAKLPRIPMYLLTGHVGHEIAQKASDAGCDGVLPKPINQARLISILDDVGSRTTAEEARAAPRLPTVAELAKKAPVPVQKWRTRAWRWLMDVPDLNLFGVWRYRGQLVLTFLNFLLAIVASLFPWLFAPLPIDPKFMFGVTLLMSLTPFFCRVKPKWLSVHNVCVQLIVSHYIVWVLKLPLDPALPPALNCLSGGVPVAGFVGAVLVCIDVALASHFVNASATSIPTTDEQVLAHFACELYLLAATGGFMIYLLLSRQRNVQTLEAERDTVESAKVDVERRRSAAAQFVESVSYDLRTPLNVALGTSERLTRMQGLAPKTMQHIRVIHSACRLLLNLMYNLLDSGEFSGDSLRTNPTAVCSLRTALQDIGGMMQFYAISRGISLRTKLSQRVPAYVYTDELRLQQVLVNLVTNAIKHTQSGGITISVDLLDSMSADIFAPIAHDVVDVLETPILNTADSGEAFVESPPLSPPRLAAELRRRHVLSRSLTSTRTGTRSGSKQSSLPSSRSSSDQLHRYQVLPMYVRITVEDTGSGMPPEIAEQLRVGVSWMSATRGGVGLGLVITRRIIALLGGRLDVKVFPGEGTAVSFVLPLQHASGAHPDHQSDISTETSLSWPCALRILIVEDVPEMQYVMSMFLQDTPHQVDAAYTGEQAVQMCSEIDYDLIFLDMILPGMGGADVLRQLRFREHASGKRPVEVIIMTAAVMGETRSLCDQLLSATVAFEPKPIARSRVMAHVARVAAELGGGDDSSPRHDGIYGNDSSVPSEPLSRNRSSVSSPNTSVWIASVPMSMMTYTRDSYMPGLRENIHRMTASLDARDTNLIRREAHKLKGTAPMFGLTKVAQAAQLLEHLCDDGGDINKLQAAVDQLDVVISTVQLVPVEDE